MKLDLYSRVVLSVIAVCLVALTGKQLFTFGTVSALTNAPQQVELVGVTLRKSTVNVEPGAMIPVEVRAIGDVWANDVLDTQDPKALRVKSKP